jgi:hypothetical protein
MCLSYSNEIDSGFCRSLKEGNPVKDTLSTEVSRLAFMDNPRRVERNTIVSHSLDFLEDIQPKARNGKSTYVRTNT